MTTTTTATLASVSGSAPPLIDEFDGAETRPHTIALSGAGTAKVNGTYVWRPSLGPLTDALGGIANGIYVHAGSTAEEPRWIGFHDCRPRHPDQNKWVVFDATGAVYAAHTGGRSGVLPREGEWEMLERAAPRHGISGEHPPPTVRREGGTTSLRHPDEVSPDDPERSPPASHQPVARKLGVHYGPTSLVRGVQWLPGDQDTERLVLELQSTIKLRAETDCWIATYPKCGTTWTHQIALLLLNSGSSDAWGGDPHGFGAPGQPGAILASWPEAQYSKAFPSAQDSEDFLSALEEVPGPRVMKTHAPWQLLPGRPRGDEPAPCKCIYVTRNPKDACVSMLYHAQAGKHLGFDGTWDQWFELWMSGEVEFGSWFDHTIGWWRAHVSPENEGRILWVAYEQLKTQPGETIRRIAGFLGVEPTAELLAKVEAESSFATMSRLNDKRQKQRPRKNNFYRKGKIGDWRNHFSTAQNEHFDRIYHEKMEGLDLRFDFGEGLIM